MIRQLMTYEDQSVVVLPLMKTYILLVTSSRNVKDLSRL